MKILTEDSKKYDLRSRAAKALCELGEPGRAALILLFHHKDETVGEYAVEALGNAKVINAVSPLIALLRTDPAGGLFHRAARALGRIGSPEAVRALIEASGYVAIKDKERNSLISIATGLGEAGPAAVEPVLAALSSPNENVRSCAGKALGELKDPRAAEPLIAMISKKNEPHRVDYVNALVSIGGSKAIETLVTCLADRDPDIRWTAAQGLGEFFKDTR